MNSRQEQISLLSAEAVDGIFRALKAANPAPKSELVYKTPYELLVAVILSAQATDISVNKATSLLFREAKTPDAMVRLGAEGIMPYVKTLNLYPTKSRHIAEMSAILLEKFGGRVPDSREALESLPGVGRKTANVILNTAFNRLVIAVDTHIFRVANRTGLAPGKNVREVEDRLVSVIPEKYLQDAHHWLLLHGRYVCKARHFDCSSCLIRDFCAYPDKEGAKTGAHLPEEKPKKKPGRRKKQPA